MKIQLREIKGSGRYHIEYNRNMHISSIQLYIASNFKPFMYTISIDQK